MKHVALPSDEDIIKWSNEMADLKDDEKKYTATGSRIAIQERCAGARWMLNTVRELMAKNQLTLDL